MDPNDKTGKADLPLFRNGQVLIGFLRPLGSIETIQEIASNGVTSFSVELMPRTTSAQSMDVLSSIGHDLRLQGGRARGGYFAAHFSDAHDGRGNDYSVPRFRDWSGVGGVCRRLPRRGGSARSLLPTIFGLPQKSKCRASADGLSSFPIESQRCRRCARVRSGAR